VGNVRTNREIYETFIRPHVPPGDDPIYVELGNFLTDVSQFRDPWAHVGGKGGGLGVKSAILYRDRPDRDSERGTAMAIQYRFRSEDAEKWSPPTDLKEATTKAAQRVRRRKAPYLVYERDHRESTQAIRPQIEKAELLLRKRLDASPIENTEIWRLESQPDGFFVAVIKAEPLAPEPAIGTAPLKVWHREVFGQIAGLTSFGIFNCRPIQGSTTPSQHSFANAEDVHGTSSQMQKIFDLTVENHKRLKVAHVIFNRKIWSSDRAAEGVRPFTGENPHTDHVHTDFNPQRSGPCKTFDE
jgi:Extensin-like protein C-terminus